MKNKKNIPFEFSDYVLSSIFKKTGEIQGWLPIKNKENESVLIAVSGGGDSVALLWFFKNFYDGKIISVHINHSIRNEEADEDAKFVRELSEKWEIDFLQTKIDVPNEKQKGESLESAARRIRHRELINIAEKNKSYAIFLGHNRDDLAETVLFNILRGTGIRGSVGIPETMELSGIKIFRPLINFRRDFLRKILKLRGISWREDYTNNDVNYTRNFIRLELLPLISEKINKNSVEHLANFGEEMRIIRNEEDLRGNELLEKSISKKIFFDNSMLSLNRKIIKSFNEHDRTLLIREIGRKFGLVTLSRHRCKELANLLIKSGNFIFQWGGGFNMIGDGEKFYVTKNS